jgi:hypothetical protein
MDGAPAFRAHADRQGPRGGRRFESNCILGCNIGPLMRIGVKVGGVQCRVYFPKASGLTSRHSAQRFVCIFPDTPKGRMIVKIASNPPVRPAALEYLLSSTQLRLQYRTASAASACGSHQGKELPHVSLRREESFLGVTDGIWDWNCGNSDKEQRGGCIRGQG